VYESFFKPYIAKHETEIDRNLLELRTRAGDMAGVYFQRIANYAQTRSYEILQYIASQSQTQRPRSQVLLPHHFVLLLYELYNLLVCPVCLCSFFLHELFLAF
jgi:hypothetical protein